MRRNTAAAYCALRQCALPRYVCAAMHKIIHIAFAILKSGRPFDPEYTPKAA